MKELSLHNNVIRESDFVKWERRITSGFTLCWVRKLVLCVARLSTPLSEFFELSSEPWHNRKAMIASFHRTTPCLLECCENYRNVVKCCETPKMLWNRLSGLPKMSGFCRFEISQHSADAQKKTCTNFSIKVHTFCRSRVEVYVFEALKSTYGCIFEQCCEMLWNF